jgi:hypothetical protein
MLGFAQTLCGGGEIAPRFGQRVCGQPEDIGSRERFASEWAGTVGRIDPPLPLELHQISDTRWL